MRREQLGGIKRGPGDSPEDFGRWCRELGSCYRSRWESRRGRECLAASEGHAIKTALGETLVGFVLKQ